MKYLNIKITADNQNQGRIRNPSLFYHYINVIRQENNIKYSWINAINPKNSLDISMRIW